ncbi:MAG: glutaredoxin [Selenomonas artemidis]|jgi:hypothetical protein
MKTLTMIEMAGCPYCANAHRAINALKAEGGAYADVPVEYIDENAEPERTKPYAGMYYYVPSLFVGGEKYYEAQPGHDYETILAAVRVAFDVITKS